MLWFCCHFCILVFMQLCHLRIALTPADTHIYANIIHTQYFAYHHLVEGDPAVRGEVLQHRNQELETAIPVTQQQHHTNQVEYSHHSTSQVIGHVEDLSGGEETGKRRVIKVERRKR